MTDKQVYLNTTSEFRITSYNVCYTKLLRSTFQQSSYFKRPAMVLKITANPLNDNLDAITEAEFKQLVKEKSEVESPVV